MKILLKVIVCLIIFYIYSPWFLFTKTLSAGDWPYLFKENILAFQILEPPFLWLDPYYQLTAKMGVIYLSLSWEITEKLFWFFPFLIISIISSWKFTNYIFRKIIGHNISIIFSIISSLVFSSNTYILMIVGGGQMGVGMAYALAPLVTVYFIELLDHEKVESHHYLKTIITSSLQLTFDPRIFIITLLTISIYELFIILNNKILLKTYFKKYSIILFCSIILNLYWILPNTQQFSHTYDEVASKIEASYYSFATFENTISILHPNWPENIFGRIHFMRFEFLFLPIFAYLSLIFLKGVKTKYRLLSLSVIGLIGAYLSKGTNDPGGIFYLWLSTLPGFMIFRDPTKFYLMTILSYMILIPLSLFFLTSRLFKPIKYLPIILFIIFWFYLLLPVWQSDLNGTFKPSTIPTEYILFRKFIINQTDNYSILWIPKKQRFGFYSENFPYIDAETMFDTLDRKQLMELFPKSRTLSLLRSEKVKYV
ncbi:MAG: hypothetical protein V1858_00005, partial [Candidatus Gottesmanbacteria bacterium]